MTPVYKLSASSFRSRTTYGSMLAGNTAYVPPKEFMLLSYLATAPYVSVWNIDNAAFGTKVADYTNPSGVTGTNGPNWSKNGTSVVVPTSGDTVRLHAYKWTAGASPAWGTKFSDPATLPGGNTSIASFTNNDVIVNCAASPYVLAYKWSDSTGFGTKYSNPATLPPAQPGGFVNDAGTAWAGGFTGSPYVHAYPYTDGTGWGTKYSDPATLPGGNAYFTQWNRANSAVVIGYEVTNYAGGTQGVWKWSSGWSTKYSDPSPAVLNYYGSQQPTFNHNDTALGWAQYSQVSGQKIQVYAWDNTNGYGSKYAQPAAGDVNDGRGFSFNYNSTAVSYASNSTPYVHLWAFSTSTGFGTKSADPATLPGGLGNMQYMRRI